MLCRKKIRLVIGMTWDGTAPFTVPIPSLQARERSSTVQKRDPRGAFYYKRQQPWVLRGSAMSLHSKRFLGHHLADPLLSCDSVRIIVEIVECCSSCPCKPSSS